jgi:uncharacterized membrane protein YfcA
VSVAEIIGVLAAVAVGAALKSITGMGLPLVAIPLVSMFWPVSEAVAVVALPNLVVNGTLIFRERSSMHQTRDLRRLVASGIPGAVIGALLLTTIPPEPIVALLAAVVLAYAVLFVVSPSRSVPWHLAVRLAPAVGLVGGFFQGAVGASGPVFGTWIHAYRLPRGAHILALSVIFFATGLSQLVVLSASGAMADVWVAALAATVVLPIVIPAAASARDRLAGETFDRLIVAVLVASVLTMLVRTLT